MSLINQMLRDLESRRDPDSAARRVIDGMGGNNPRRAAAPLIAVIALVTLTLGAVMAYLLLQNNDSITTPEVAESLRNSAPSNKKSEATAPVTRTVKKSETNPPLEVKAEPAGITPLVEKHPPASAPGDTHRAPSLQTPDTTEPVTKSAPPSRVAESRDDEAMAATRIEKRIRPLRPSQIAEQRYQEGYRLLQRGDRGSAEAKWLSALEADPTHIASREAIAALLLSQSRRVEAAEQLQQGLDYHPGHGQFALLLARLQLENDNSADAIKVMERALQEQGQSADFYAFLAAVYQRQGDYPKSISAYQRALSQQPGQAVWWMGIGISLERSGKREEALTAYGEALDTGGLSDKLQAYVQGRIQNLK